jgi:hypothetical protein
VPQKGSHTLGRFSCSAARVNMGSPTFLSLPSCSLQATATQSLAASDQAHKYRTQGTGSHTMRSN